VGSDDASCRLHLRDGVNESVDENDHVVDGVVCLQPCRQTVTLGKALEDTSMEDTQGQLRSRCWNPGAAMSACGSAGPNEFLVAPHSSDSQSTGRPYMDANHVDGVLTEH
jgi:hypothetical protein